jgi:hypothetical protein
MQNVSLELIGACRVVKHLCTYLQLVTKDCTIIIIPCETCDTITSGMLPLSKL